MKKPINLISLAVITAVVISSIYFTSKAKGFLEQDKSQSADVQKQSETLGAGVGNNNSQSVVNVKVVGGNFSFSPAEIKVRKGDLVRIEFYNSEGFHDFVLDEFNTKTAQIKAGETEVVEFVADKVGSFEYYCSVGKHREMGMVGKLIVE